MAGNWSVILPPLGWNHVISDSLRSRLQIMFFELGDPENAQGIPALMTLLRDRSTTRMRWGACGFDAGVRRWLIFITASSTAEVHQVDSVYKQQIYKQ